MHQSWGVGQVVSLVLACAIGMPCMAASRIGSLEVRAGKASAACFTIAQAQERRTGAPQFDAISVSDTANPRLALWSMVMPRERTFAVSFQMCIPYGGRLPVLPQTAAAALAPGRIYEATMAPRAPPAGAPRLYRARFCLRPPRVLQLAPGDASCPP